MSASLDVASDWNFRVFDKRLVMVKAKDEKKRTAAFLDELKDLTFLADVPDMISMNELAIDKEYLANLRVYTSKETEGVAADFTDFFETLDVDQTIEDFIKAYLVYPNKIRFELVELEEP